MKPTQPLNDPQPAGPVQAGSLGREWSDTGMRYGTHPAKVLLRREPIKPHAHAQVIPAVYALQWVPNGSQWPVHQRVTI